MRALVACWMLVFGLALSASEVAPMELTLSQPDGSAFQAKPRGNRYISWMETLDGYTVVRGTDGFWHFAQGDGRGGLRPGNRIVGRDLPPATAAGLRPALNPADLEPAERPRRLNTAQEGAVTQDILVLLVSFSDISFTYATTTFDSLMFGAGGSVKDYYLENSYNNFTLTPATESQGTANDGLIEVTLGYAHPNQGQTSSASRTVAMDAVTAASAGGFIDFSIYDDNGDGSISAAELSIVLILAGYENAFGGSSSLTPRVWGHKSSFSTTSLNGVDLAPYTMFGEAHATSLANKRIASIGIMCHELGHLMLGLPDLYDRDGSSAGIGDWGLMASGSWNSSMGVSGDTPAHLCAWSKEQVGFLTPDVVSSAMTGVSIGPANSSASAKKIWLDKYKIGEYFLLSSREVADYDAGLPGAGLMIWHIDELAPSQNDDETHKLVDVEEADGLAQMDSNSNDGDGGDPYPGTGANTSFSDSTNPNAKDYDGADTGVVVENIATAKRATMSLDITPATVATGDHIRYDELGAGGASVGFGSTTVWTGLDIENTTSLDTLDGFGVYLAEASTVDFYLYESLSGTTPITLLHSQTGFAGSAGWNRFLLAVAQSFPQSATRIMVLRIVGSSVTSPAAYDGSGVFSGRSYLASNGSGSFTLLSSFGDLNQHVLLSSTCAAPAVTSQPLSQTVCAGDGVTLTVTADGDGLSYQWRKGGVDIGGAVTSSYNIASFAGGDAADYDCVVTGTCGSDTSSTATLSLGTTTAVTTDPVTQAVCAGAGVTFTVVADGDNLSYQWRKGGVAIGGASSASYTIASVSSGDAGDYDCVVSGDCGDDTSTAATLTVPTTTAISVQPSGDSLCPGENTTFTVTASGSNLSYQWRKGGIAIGGATAASYTITGAVVGDAGNYDCVVSGDCGSDTSSTATLTVGTATAITTQPLTQSVCSGESVTFTVAADGSNLSYQWRKDGTPIGGATSASYTIPTLAVGDAGGYDCVVSGDCGDETSSAAGLTVPAATAISGQPSGAGICPGDNTTFTVSASGSNLSYQWRKGGVDIGGATSASYTITGAVVGDAGNYDCEVSGDCGDLISGTATLTVGTATAITTQPLTQSVCSGESVTFTVAADGSNLSYQWRKNGSPIGGATSASYTIATLVVGDAGGYDCVVSGDCGDETSSAAGLTVPAATAISGQPSGADLCQGDDITFTVAATGSNLSYQWRKNGVDIPGATTAAYALTDVVGGDAGSYSCSLSGDCGVLISDTAVLTVGTSATVVSQPEDANRCEGSSVTFQVSATGGGLSYQWRLDMVDIPGATNAILTLTNLQLGDAGDYDCVVGNGCGTETSDVAMLTIDMGEYAVAITPGNIAQGLAPITLGAVVDCGSPDYTYTWREVDTQVVVGNAATLTVSPIPLETTSFELEVVDGAGGNDTDVATILVSAVSMDLDGDGFNDINDLLLALPTWRGPLHYDANGDGILNVLDFLYIRTQ